jgi:type IV pilus assembly protein PilY1
MKRLIWLILLLALLLPSWAVAAMDNYCSAPPYVTRKIAPNIMVLMDNSLDMYEPAYSGAYDPATTYIGYFKSTSCYSESGNKFEEVLETPPHTPPDPPNPPPTCTAAAPFRGNVMNWATMSRYDVLQKVLLGGNSTSKQGNASTLVSIGGTFPDKIYNSCIFRVENANLTLTESLPGACSLLNDPAVPMARLNPFKSFWDAFSRGTEILYDVITGGIEQAGTAFLAVWENINLVSRAWAAQLTLTVVSGSSYTLQSQAYTLTLEAGGDNNTDYNWAIADQPAWLSGPTYIDSANGQKVRYRAVFSGTPTVAGTYDFTVTVSDTDGNTEISKDYSIVVEAEPVKINTLALSPGQVGNAYSFTPVAQGGVPYEAGTINAHYLWSASGLPAWASLDSVSGRIYGTPNAPATNNVTLTARDNNTPTGEAISAAMSLTITSPALNILTDSLAVGTQNVNLLSWLEVGGGVPSGTPPRYTWTATGLPAGVSLIVYDTYTAYLWGVPTVAGTFPVTIEVEDSLEVTTSKTLSLLINPAAGGALTILETSPLPDATKGQAYYFDFHGAGGGIGAFVWSQSGLPAGVNVIPIGDYYRINNWVPTASQIGSHNFTVTLTKGAETVSKNFTITVKPTATTRTKSIPVKVGIFEETLVNPDPNGNDIWDEGEPPWVDIHNGPNEIGGSGNGVWDGKQGLFQKFWDTNTPKARWGMTKFVNTTSAGVTTGTPRVATCVPAAPVGSWYTNIQNATAATTAPLATGLYEAIKYYDFNGGFSGCTNSDPIDDTIPCRKNFILVLSSGNDVDGTALDAGSTGCSQSDPLVKNACVGFNSDLRAPDGTQNVYTYVVNTMGTNAANNLILADAADAGGGTYYEATNAATLATQLTRALDDITAHAASGTAVSVLTTSSRGIGSMVQAYFLPVRSDGGRDIKWTGYTQDLWIDPQDNLREDTINSLQLDISNDLGNQDRVVKLFFDTETNETKVARFTTLADGSGGSLEGCAAEYIELFSATNYLWEAGQKLALKNPADRILMTSKKVIHGSTTTTITDNNFHVDNVATLSTALNPETLTATEIIEYVRGVDKETAEPAKFRDRRLTVGGSLQVWKLGDVISSTPKVFANTPGNTYHIDYGDSSYFSYITSPDYKERSSFAFVGANDGVLHAFKVGYLQDTGLTDTIKGIFTNIKDETPIDEIGQEMWGFIPFNAFPYLQYLANLDYCHIYFNDLSVRIVDASVGNESADMTAFPTATKELESWRSILVGGMRFGGACDSSVTPTPALPMAGGGYSSYYAIDITDPDDPQPLWEFSNPDMGYATTFPSIVRTGDKDDNGNWYVAIGSGSSKLPKSTVDMDRTTEGYVYLLDLKSGALVKKVGLGHNAIVSDIVAIDSQKDANVDTLYFGTSYPNGLTGDLTIWGGKQMSLNVAGNVAGLCGSTLVDRSAADCGANLKVIFDGAFPFTASPDVARDPSGNIWLYAGAGKYVSDIDEEDAAEQIFLGIKTNLAASNYPIRIGVTDTDDFIDRTTVATSGTVTSTRSECLYDPTGSGPTQFSPQLVVTGITPDAASLNVSIPPLGWYLTLTGGERVISRPLAVGGLVDFLTYLPDSNLCSYGGSSYLYAVDYLKGIAPTNVAIRSPETTDGQTTMSTTVTIRKGIRLGPGAPPTGEAITIPPPKEGQEQLKKKIQVATGVIVETENTPVISTISKVVHWLKK